VVDGLGSVESVVDGLGSVESGVAVVLGVGATAPLPLRRATIPIAPIAMMATLAAALHTRGGTRRRGGNTVAPDACSSASRASTSVPVRT
jgi:hypothetical protein